MRPIRQRLQIIFQDPVSSLNPRRRVKDIVAEPLIIAGMKDAAEIDRKVREVLNAVGMDPDITLDRRPHQFSGGQCQRICIARALIMEPKLIVCDEPVSALDVSVQAQILNLLEDMKERYGLTLLFISHDLAVVKNISDRVAVMYLGKFCELADSERIYEAPAHPYTAGLMATIPEIGDKAIDGGPALAGEIPSPLNPPSGCRFRTRCPHAQEKCAAEEPAFRDIETGHQVACHFPLLGG
jgi:peptide/nickel transport system ATP-binding protein